MKELVFQDCQYQFLAPLKVTYLLRLGIQVLGVSFAIETAIPARDKASIFTLFIENDDLGAEQR